MLDVVWIDVLIKSVGDVEEIVVVDMELDEVDDVMGE